MGYHDRRGSPETGHEVYANWPCLSNVVRTTAGNLGRDDQPAVLQEKLGGKKIAFFNGSEAGTLETFFVCRHPNDQDGLFRYVSARAKGIEQDIDLTDERWRIEPMSTNGTNDTDRANLVNTLVGQIQFLIQEACRAAERTSKVSLSKEDRAAWAKRRDDHKTDACTALDRLAELAY